MALPQRIDPIATPALPRPNAPPLSPLDAGASPWGEDRREAGYRPGGEVGRLHAELAARLGGGIDIAVPPSERFVRRLSKWGGYAALAAGYVGVALLVLR